MVTAIQELGDGGPDHVEDRHLKHSHGYCLEYKNNPKLRWKKVIYHFADGISINNKHFNEGVAAESRDLKTVVKMYPKRIEVPHRGKKVKVSTYQAILYWKVAIIGAESPFHEDEEVKKVADAFVHLRFFPEEESTRDEVHLLLENENGLMILADGNARAPQVLQRPIALLVRPVED